MRTYCIDRSTKLQTTPCHDLRRSDGDVPQQSHDDGKLEVQVTCLLGNRTGVPGLYHREDDESLGG